MSDFDLGNVADCADPHDHRPHYWADWDDEWFCPGIGDVN